MLKNVSESAKSLRVGESTLRRWIREGRLAAVRLGRRVLIREETLKSFVNAAESDAE